MLDTSQSGSVDVRDAEKSFIDSKSLALKASAMDMCIDMCIDVCIDMCIDMCIDACMDMFRYVCTDMFMR